MGHRSPPQNGGGDGVAGEFGDEVLAQQQQRGAEDTPHGESQEQQAVAQGAQRGQHVQLRAAAVFTITRWTRQ